MNYQSSHRVMMNWTESYHAKVRRTAVLPPETTEMDTYIHGSGHDPVWDALSDPVSQPPEKESAK